MKKEVVILLVLAQLAFAQQINWQQTSAGSCSQTTHCLVNNNFNPFLDTFESAYWDGLLNPSEGPKCLANGQFILDHYCNNGVWSSRTKQVALRLLTLGSSASQFTLQCGKPEQVLPRDQLTNDGYAFDLLRSCTFSSFNSRPFVESCANSFCVLKYGNAVALGASLNSQIDSSQSVLRAFGKPITLCSGVLDNNSNYDSCSAGFWYDHQTKSLIYAPGINNIPRVTQTEIDLLELSIAKLENYVSANVHNPLLPQRNYSFFTKPELTEFFVTKNGARFTFGFKQTNVTLLQTDYIGLYLSGIRLPADSCAKLFKRFDDRVHCEIQPTQDEFYLVASRQLAAPQGLVDKWQDLVVT